MGLVIILRLSKGNLVNIPEQEKWMHNVVTQGMLGDICRSPGKSSLFFLTFFASFGIFFKCDKRSKRGRAIVFLQSSGALLRILENPNIHKYKHFLPYS